MPIWTVNSTSLGIKSSINHGSDIGGLLVLHETNGKNKIMLLVLLCPAHCHSLVQNEIDVDLTVGIDNRIATISMIHMCLTAHATQPASQVLQQSLIHAQATNRRIIQDLKVFFSSPS